MKLCLNMIVKDEAHVIRRCLASVRDHIDYWVIVDTGSTDGTQSIIKEFLKEVPGELHERPWKNFGHNRTEALRLAEGKADYLLFIDADEQLIVPEGFIWPELDQDAYFVNVSYGPMNYARCAIVSTRLKWSWKGVLHEYLESDSPSARANLPGPYVLVTHDGARAKDKDTYKKDAELLRNALKEEPQNARYQFYLAQSLFDSQQWEQSREEYKKRSEMGGWPEEVWYSHYRMGQLSEILGMDPTADYLAAYEYRPIRAEPLHALARYCRGKKRFYQAAMFADVACNMQKPEHDLLFLEPEVYAWRALDEFSVACFYANRHEEGLDAVRWLLKEVDGIPQAERDRIEKNLEYYTSK